MKKVSDFARAVAALKNMWVIEGLDLTMRDGSPSRMAVVARPVNDTSYIAAAIFEMLPQFIDNDAVWLEILSQLERTEHI